MRELDKERENERITQRERESEGEKRKRERACEIDKQIDRSPPEKKKRKKTPRVTCTHGNILGVEKYVNKIIHVC